MKKGEYFECKSEKLEKQSAKKTSEQLAKEVAEFKRKESKS